MLPVLPYTIQNNTLPYLSHPYMAPTHRLTQPIMLIYSLYLLSFLIQYILQYCTFSSTSQPYITPTHRLKLIMLTYTHRAVLIIHKNTRKRGMLQETVRTRLGSPCT